jgi:hypothetical protein
MVLDVVRGDALVPAAVLDTLEERYLRPIAHAAKLERLLDDPLFLADPINHPALFSDHGPIHVRDVAACYRELAETANGLLISRRPPERLEFLVAYGLLATYLHDIGMLDLTAAGRRLHPIYAAHAVFAAGFEDLIDSILGFDGPLARRLQEVQEAAPLPVPSHIVLRELLSLTLVHSKSLVPASLLDDRDALRNLVKRAVLTDLETHRATDQALSADGAEPFVASANTDWYESPLEDSFAWLTSQQVAHRSLADDVLDALRLLRVADALRQRGTSLRTTGGYEVLIDAATGEVVFSLRTADDARLYLLRGHNARSAGEANLRAVAVTAEGQVRIAFHRGAYLEPEAAIAAAGSASLVIGEILADVLPMLTAGTPALDLPAPVRTDEPHVQVERPRDNPDFADLVARLVAAVHPESAGRISSVEAELASPEGATQQEWRRFHRGVAVDPGSKEARHCLKQLAQSGAKVDGLDLDEAFAELRRVVVAAGEIVMMAGSPSGFVYIPTGPGLRVEPTGGYPAAALSPWVPVGTTGVIRRAERNGDVTAERELELLVIPGERYVRAWFRPYAAAEFVSMLGRLHGP